MDVKFTDNSDKALEEFNAAMMRAAVRIGQQAAGYAGDLAPVGTPESTGVPGYIGGLLRNSIAYAVSGESPNISSYTDDGGIRRGEYSGTVPLNASGIDVYVGSNVEYAAYVEMGTAKMKAQPYLKPAAANHAQTYRNIVEDEMKNG